jgi:chemotaxis signal transduction protein
MTANTCEDVADSPALATGAGVDVSRYVVVEINASFYGFITDATVELMSGASIPVTRVPKSPRFVNGVINHRGSIIPVVDTRALLGLPTAAEQAARLTEALAARERELTEWADELAEAMHAREGFSRPVDAAALPFARWHKSVLEDPRKLQAVTRHGAQARAMFDELLVHFRALCKAGADAVALAGSGQHDEAAARADAARPSDLEPIRRLVRRMTQAISEGSRSMLVITELGDRRAAFVVDAVHAVKDCAERDVDALPESATGGEFLRGLVHQPGGGYILIFDLERMYELACPR